ncbi:MAG: hypothetical protein KF878_23905 [Planctomycetes bacterium]|nr:hypothetical protein [Planctomycetota bacterium]
MTIIHVATRPRSATPSDEARSTPSAPAPPPAPAAPVTELGIEAFAAPLVDERVFEPPPRSAEAAGGWRDLEGDPDAGYRDAVDPEPCFGGIDAAPTWRDVCTVPFSRPLRVFAAGGRVVLVGERERQLAVLEGPGEEVARVTLADRPWYGAISGNRLLLTLADRPALVAVDLDRGEALPAEIPLDAPQGIVVTCAREPRRAYVLAGGRLHLIDAGRMRLVASTPRGVVIPSSTHPRALKTDGRGRLLYVDTRTYDPANGFAEVHGAGRGGEPDAEGRFLFDAHVVVRAGSHERVDAPGGQLLGELPDGTLLVRTEEFTVFERRDPETARPVGERFADPDRQGSSYDPSLPPMLIAGTRRLLRAPSYSTKLQVMDIAGPADRRPSRQVRLAAAAPTHGHVGEEWIFSPRVTEPTGARVHVEGPSGLRWDGTTARWRPAVEQAGYRSVTLVVTTDAGEEERLTLPVRVQLLTLPAPKGLVRPLRALPSGRLAVGWSATHIVALEPGTWRTRALSLAGCRGLVEVGDALWVLTDDGALVELGCPDLTPRAQHRVAGTSPVALAALPDGRLSWIAPRGGARIHLGRFAPGASRSEVVEGATERVHALDLVWLDAERVVIADALWRWSQGALTRLAPADPPRAVLPDGTVFLSERVLRPDGSTLRGHAEGAPCPSHDGTYYAAVDMTTDGVRLGLYGLPDGRRLTSFADPVAAASSGAAGRRGLLLASRARTVVVWDLGAPDTLFLVPYEPSSWKEHDPAGPR